MTAKKTGPRRTEIPQLVIVAVREALGRGEPVARVAAAYGVSRRYCRDLKVDAHRRPEAVVEPPEIEALATVTGELAPEAKMMREIWGILAGR